MILYTNAGCALDVAAPGALAVGSPLVVRFPNGNETAARVVAVSPGLVRVQIRDETFRLFRHLADCPDRPQEDHAR